ncbi:hypothetical protein [Bifidobacterium oedipodis]|uniref:Uncharacterized protein n=1 Tax=Bifidobacterium oedipodis TaxID=2675322 RepID=A0A7Y0HSD7_9BIFI|nr:hypothetical protein [Bifidobacterium sp. DSM 109957]NMM93901.1 hypothetical protein [Bifidobacterium sp. DSM 109957]
MCDVNIVEENGRVVLTAPYCEDANAEYRKLNGRWDAGEKVWRFDARDSERVKALASRFFGWEEPDVAGPKVTIRVHAKQFKTFDGIVLANRELACRPDWDSPVRLADNVVVVEGAFADRSGRSIIGRVDDDVVLEVRDLPYGALRLLDEGSYDLVEPADRLSLLRGERERLLKRLAEIDRLLGETENAA